MHELTVLITGASAGIGEATAYAFAEQGSRLFLVARRAERLKTVAGACEKKGASAVAFSVHDLSRPGEGGKLVQKCLREMADLGVLICNAGYGIQAPVTETTPEMMSRIWQVNYQSAYESIYEALPYLLQKRQGHIILTSSILGKKGTPFSAAYAATKFAQVGLGESLWGELLQRHLQHGEVTNHLRTLIHHDKPLRRHLVLVKQNRLRIKRHQKVNQLLWSLDFVNSRPDGKDIVPASYPGLIGLRHHYRVAAPN